MTKPGRMAIAVVMLAAALHPAAAQAQVPDNTVTAVGVQFVPPVAVAQGTSPGTFRNGEVAAVPHNVYWQVFVPPSGSPTVSAAGFVLCATMQPGQSCVVNTATKPLPKGVYAYTCTVNAAHTAAMHGVLVVT